MSPVSLMIMSFSMSADAFAVSISRGVSMKTPSIVKSLKVGLLFGFIEGLTPLIGWFVGLAASSFIESVDHWIAFVILSLVGAKMIYENLKSSSDDTQTNHPKSTTASDGGGGSIGLLILTAIGTSIDAMAVGVSLAFIDVNIWIAAACIGLATTLMVFIGMMTGQYLGSKVGKYAEILGGIALILIGSQILLSHTGYI